MGSAERAKGNRAEQAVARFLREHGFDAVTSRAANGTQGGSDILTNLPFAIEVKDHARIDLSGWWRQASADTPEGKIPLVWHKRRGFASPGRWWVTMDGDSLIRLFHD
jgi:hypothetical protein